MHIPRQSGRSPGPRSERVDGAVELRARRTRLLAQLSAVGYWQQLVRARTDLCVAGLLYASPVPTAVPTAVPGSDWCACTVGGDVHLMALAIPPDGLDVQRLLGDVVSGGRGEQLERLREVASVLVRRSRALQEELDVLSTALHESLAGDGADQGRVRVATGVPARHPA